MALPLDPFPAPPQGELVHRGDIGFTWEAPPLPELSDLPLAAPGRPIILGRPTIVDLCTEAINAPDEAIPAWIERLHQQAVAGNVAIVLTGLRSPGAGRWTMTIRSALRDDHTNDRDPTVPKHPGLRIFQHGRYGRGSFDDLVAKELARLLEGEELWRPWPETEWELNRRGISYTIRPDALFENFFVEVVR
jgi:hypothetical protein